MSKSKKPAKLHPFRGDMKTVKEIAEALNLTERAVYSRIKEGQPLTVERLRRGPLPDANSKRQIKKRKTPKEDTDPSFPILPRNINRRTDLSALFSHG